MSYSLSIGDNEDMIIYYSMSPITAKLIGKEIRDNSIKYGLDDKLADFLDSIDKVASGKESLFIKE